MWCVLRKEYQPSEEAHSDSHSNTDGSRKHYAKCKKSIQKGHVSDGSIYVKCPEQAKLYCQNAGR